MNNLTRVYLTALNSASAQSEDLNYALRETVSVYLLKNGSYALTGISSVADAGSYTLYGYYDQTPTAGGRIRIVIATEKE